MLDLGKLFVQFKALWKTALMKDHSFVNSVLGWNALYVPLLILTEDFCAHIMKDTSYELFHKLTYAHLQHIRLLLFSKL